MPNYLIGKMLTHSAKPLKFTAANRAAVFRDMSRSRNTIFQSLGLSLSRSSESRFRLRLGTLKSRQMGMSWPYLKVRFKIA